MKTTLAKSWTPPNAATRTVLDGLRRLVQILRISGREAERIVGVSGAQLFVLSKLAAARGCALSINQLAARTHTHQSSVSVVVSRLVERGLVNRERSESDGRLRALSLTPAAQMLLNKAPQTAQDRIVTALEAMPAVRRRQLAELLSELVQQTGAPAGATPQMFLESAESNPRKRSAHGRRASRS